jgi:DNA polymerase-3 subunit epsilon
MQQGNIKCEGVMKARPSFAIIEKGLSATEQSCVLMLNGEFYGMGYIPRDIQINDVDTLAGYLTRYKDNGFIRNLILSYAEKNTNTVKQLDNLIIS